MSGWRSGREPRQLELWAAPPLPPVGEVLRRVREAAGWSQAGLARTLGISQPALSRSEAGLRQLDHDELVLAAGALRCSLEALAGEGAVAVRRHVGRGRPGRWPESQRLATIVLTDHLWSFVDQGGSATALASAAAGRAPLSAGQARIAVQVVRGASNAADPA